MGGIIGGSIAFAFFFVAIVAYIYLKKHRRKITHFDRVHKREMELALALPQRAHSPNGFHHDVYRLEDSGSVRRLDIV
jgi:cbb3-type cytochrome oxidase subunit 3